jgi:hypothetical protein
MARAYFLGIGGSGAKVLEPFVHLCAAGLGPEQVWVGLIDQDAGNGHVTHAQQLVEQYERAREGLRPQAQDTLGPGTRFLRSDLRHLDSGALWQPETRHNATLAEHILQKNLLPEAQQHLMDCLFSPEEQTLRLDKGFCGRPNLGSVVFAQAIPGSRFWRELTGSIQTAARTGEDVSVFLAGSICGGTGAAGFPTLCRVLHEISGKDRVRLGGALLLPYFTFPSQDEAQARTSGAPVVPEVAADAAAFLEETAEALAYYYRLLGDTPILDHLYLVGSDPLHVLTYRSLGGPSQRNPPLIPELYAALAAARFMGQPPSGEVVQYIGHTPGVLSWHDLPGVVDGTGRELSAREHLGRLLRFAQAFNAVYEFHLRGGEWRAVRNQAWFLNLIAAERVDLDDSLIQEKLQNTRDYCRQVLAYFADLSFAGSTSDLDIRLIQADQFAKPVRNGHSQWSELTVPSASAQSQFSRFVGDIEGQPAASLREIMEGLAYTRVRPPRQSLGVFCGALFDHCALK